MEFIRDDNNISEEPVSPTGQYFNSSALSICVLAVLEVQIPIDDSPTMSLLQNLFLPINPRFSSIMVTDKNGVKQWKKFEVKLQDHINIPTFPIGLSPNTYETHFNDYLSRIAITKLPQNRPLWEIHLFKYPTKNAAGSLIFKLHHALGDGFSLMGALISCLQRADNPYLPLTFPSIQWPSKIDSQINTLPKFLSAAYNTVSDFGWSLLKSGFVEDDETPIRSGVNGVEFKPIVVTTMNFSLDHIKQMKAKLGVTINDVITGIIFFGVRLYMKAAPIDHKINNAQSTALVLLNTRNIGGYKSVKEMVKPDAESPWGNQFGFLHVPLPEIADTETSNSLQFVHEAHEIIKRKRSSLAVNLTGQLLETLRKLRGPEVTAKYIHSTLKNSSMTISNLIGPLEQMALANHPISGLYFMVVGVPQSLTITMVSYMGNLRVAVGTEKGFIDSHKFKSCMEDAFGMVHKAANEVP